MPVKNLEERRNDFADCSTMAKAIEIVNEKKGRAQQLFVLYVLGPRKTDVDRGTALHVVDTD